MSWRNLLATAALAASAVGGCDADDTAPADDDDGATDEAPIVPGDPRYERDPALDTPLTSSPEATNSHLEGNNCMLCHQEFGPGRGRFTVGGTLYDAEGIPRGDAAVEIRTGPAGEGDLLATIAVDTRGNFYTTEPMPFPDEAFIFVRSSRDDGLVNEMPFPAGSGACNLCHTESLRVILRDPAGAP